MLTPFTITRSSTRLAVLSLQLFPLSRLNFEPFPAYNELITKNTIWLVLRAANAVTTTRGIRNFEIGPDDHTFGAQQP